MDCVNTSVDASLKDILRAAELAVKIGSEDELNPIKYITLAEQLLETRVSLFIFSVMFGF